MTTRSAAAPATTEFASRLPAPRLPAIEHRRTGTRLQVHTTRPRPGTTVLAVHGSLDEVTTPHLRELLDARLSGLLRTLVLDFTGLDFLGVEALNLLLRASRRAEMAGISLLLVDDPPPCVERALRAGQLDDHFTRVRLAPEADAEPGIATA